MDITIDKNLKRFRAGRGNTQEELAAFLSVSPQAVSKWERGETMPDVAQLPRIALYYNTSVDDLLGVGELRKKEKINEYLEKSKKLRNKGLLDEDLKLWRKAQSEFPNEIEVLSELMYILYNIDNENDCDEVIEIAERILLESKDAGFSGGAIQLLCYVYDNKGDYEKAKEYALMAGNIWVSSDTLLTGVLKGEEQRKYCLYNLLEHLDLIGHSINRMCNDQNYDRYAFLHEFYLKLMELYFDDGFYGFYATRAMQRHYWLSRINIGSGEKCREHLEEAYRFAKQYDSLDGEYTYTSTLLNGFKGNMDNTSKHYAETETGLLKKWIADPHFDSVREKEWFKALEARLSEL